MSLGSRKLFVVILGLLSDVVIVLFRSAEFLSPMEAFAGIFLVGLVTLSVLFVVERFSSRSKDLRALGSLKVDYPLTKRISSTRWQEPAQ